MGGLTHMLRRANSYAALMAGMTAAIVVLPLLLSSGSSLDLAVARVECTLIGVIVVTVVTGLFTPNAQRNSFYARVRTLAADVVVYVAHVLEHNEHQELERRILAEISDLEPAAEMVLAGSIDGYRRMRHVNAFVAASLALMAAGQTIKRRSNQDLAIPPGLTVNLNEFADRLRTDRPQTVISADVQATIAQAQPGLKRLADALVQLVGAQAALCSPEAEAIRSFGKNSITVAPRYEWGLARNTGLVAGGATFAAAALGLLSGWNQGELVALGVCIFSMVLGSMPKPQVIAPHMFKGLIAGAVVATFYRFVVAPHVFTVPELIVSLMPFILAGAFARASRKTALPALDANMCFLLASQAVLPIVTDTTAILGGALAIILAGTMVTTGFRLLPRRSAPLVADAAHVIVRDLRRLISGAKDSKDDNWQPRALRQTLRMMLHLGRANDLRQTASKDMLAALNLGNAVIDIRALTRQPGLSAWDNGMLEDALETLGDFARLPQATAETLLVLASQVSSKEAVMALRDAAYSVLEGTRLFELGRA